MIEKPCPKCRRMKFEADFLYQGKISPWCTSCIYHLRKYNISITEYNELLELQDRACAICNRTGQRLCIDHDRRTGKVRGLLCTSCNTGLGQFGDDVGYLHRAINYLTLGPHFRGHPKKDVIGPCLEAENVHPEYTKGGNKQ